MQLECVLPTPDNECSPQLPIVSNSVDEIEKERVKWKDLVIQRSMWSWRGSKTDRTDVFASDEPTRTLLPSRFWSFACSRPYSLSAQYSLKCLAIVVLSPNLRKLEEHGAGVTTRILRCSSFLRFLSGHVSFLTSISSTHAGPYPVPSNGVLPST